MVLLYYLTKIDLKLVLTIGFHCIGQSRFIFVQVCTRLTTPGGRKKRVGDKNAPTNGPLDCGYQERRRDEKGRTRKGGKKAVSG